MKNYQDFLNTYEKNAFTLVDQHLKSHFKDEQLTFDRSQFAGGLTNYNYIMEIQGKEYIVRQPGPLTELMIDRQMEQKNTQAVSEFSINANCVSFDPETGIKVSEFIENSHNLAVANPFAEKNLHAVAELLKKVHTLPVHFSNRFNWEAELAKYEDIILTLNGTLFFDYENLKQKALAYMATHIQEPLLVPCHNDTVPENFLLDAQDNYYLIDWEYSGLNDPNFDLAAFILETRLSEDAITTLLSHYYGAEVATKDLSKLKAYMLQQDLLWMIWALIRHYCGENYSDYCDMRYERFRKNVQELTNDEDYPLHAMVLSK